MNSDSDIGHQVLSEDEIVEACIANTATENDSSEGDDDDMEEPVGLTNGEATTMLEKLKTYFEKQSDTSSAELLTLRRLRDRPHGKTMPVFFKAKEHYGLFPVSLKMLFLFSVQYCSFIL